ncbi:MAG: methyl-accepting chemotaxis protein [Pseudomonadota bacterium]
MRTAYADPTVAEEATSDTAEDIVKFIAAQIGIVRTACYEAVIDAAAAGTSGGPSLQQIRERVVSAISAPERALTEDMLHRFRAADLTMPDDLDKHRMSVLAAIAEMRDSLNRIAHMGSDDADLADGFFKLRKACMEKMQPATADFLALLRKFEGEEINRSVVERQQYVLSSIGGIESVAARINLIAINVAIEASRAGERGAAFSVIAKEIQDLATRAKSATDEITRRIKA